MRDGHRRQLEDISSQLLLFESNLRSKEKQLQDTLGQKDQVILKQQRVIKRLLKKCHGGDFAEALSNAAQQQQKQQAEPSTESSTSATSGGREDADSAIILDDHLTEVRLKYKMRMKMINAVCFLHRYSIKAHAVICK